MIDHSAFRSPHRLPKFPSLPRIAAAPPEGAPLPQVLEVDGRPVGPTDVDPPGYLRVHVGKQAVRLSLLLAVRELRADVARFLAPALLERLTAEDRQVFAFEALSRVGTVESVEHLPEGMLKVSYSTHDVVNEREVSRTITIPATKFLPAFSPPIDTNALVSLVGRSFRLTRPKAAV